MTATIPIAPDVAALIGPNAEQVDNRSLLLDKFVFHKQWPGLEKSDDASRWSFIRIADGAAEVLHRQASELRRKADGQNVENQNRDRMRREAGIAESLAKVKWEDRELRAMRAAHARRFLRGFLAKGPDKACVVIARLEGRLAINLADSLIQNAGICLDRIFGLPYIPGSAVKGIARAAALEKLMQAAPAERTPMFGAFRRVFGSADNDFRNGELKDFARLLGKGDSGNLRGAINFIPAYPLDEARIVVDLTNVHYPDYYRRGQTDLLREEKPQPNPFPVVETGASFGFCLVLNGLDSDPALLKQAAAWLQEALTVHGIGAKTAAGYGWFSIDPQALVRFEAEERKVAEDAANAARLELERKRQEQAEAERLAAMTPEQREAEQLWKSMNEEDFKGSLNKVDEFPEEKQRAFILLCRTVAAGIWRAERAEYEKVKGNDKKAAKSKSFKRVSKILSVAQKLGESLT